MAFRKTDNRWSPVLPEAPNRPAPLRKVHGLQGPIDDAFMDSFVFVRPTGTASNPKVGEWAAAELERAIRTWKVNFRGEARVVDDKDVTPELMQSAHLVLWGDPASNSVLGQLMPQLPFQWNEQDLKVGGTTYEAASRVPVLIYPNPLSPSRYIVINSSYTFRNGSNETNALQTPKLPDWAIVDLRTPADHRWPGLVEHAGFFDENWQFPKRR